MISLESYAYAIIQLSSEGVVTKETLSQMASIGVSSLAQKTGFLWDEKAYKSFESTMKMFGVAESVKDGVKYDIAYLQSMSGFGPAFSQYMLWKEVVKEVKGNEGIFNISEFKKRLTDSCVGMFFDLSESEDSVPEVSLENVDVVEEKAVETVEPKKSVKKPRTSKSKLSK